MSCVKRNDGIEYYGIVVQQKEVWGGMAKE